jgi:hypothetical protein
VSGSARAAESRPAQATAFAVALALVCSSASAATFTFVNQDAAGEGLSDTAAFIPVGGNNATTLGQARMNVLQEAGRVWGQQLSSSIPIVVEAKFDPLTCTATTGTLGSAGARVGFASFPNATLTNVFYPAALADALAGSNLNSENDIGATFSSTVDGSATCLGGRTFYLGLNHQPGSNIDLLTVVLHELGHGLGFESVIQADGTSFLSSGRLAVFDQFLYSESVSKFFPNMTATERQTAAISNGSLVWNGASVNGQSNILTGGLSPGTHLKVYAPTTYDDGSSTSHWDTSAQWSVAGTFRSLLMEPFITANPQGLTDLTGCALRDMGWTGTRCPDNSSVPVAQPQTINGTEDTALQITLFGTNANSTSPLTYAIASQPTRGSLTAPASLSSSNGVIYTYTPSANLNSIDSFTFQVSNGTTTSSAATVTINVAAVNDPPVANAQSVSTAAGTAVSLTLSGSDVENSPLTYTVVTNPANGTLSGTAPNLSYTPSAGFSGTNTFTFRVNDGTVNSPDATITINVSAPPAASSGGGGGGGGALSGYSLALLLLLELMRRAAPIRCMATSVAPLLGKHRS